MENIKLKDHKEIGAVVLEQVEYFRAKCYFFARLVTDVTSTDFKHRFGIKFTAYNLMLRALEDLCEEYDFDCVTTGDDDA